MTPAKTEKSRSVWPGGLILAALAAVCTALVSVTHEFTAPLIHANEQAYIEASLKPLLGGIEFEHELTRSVTVLPMPHALPGQEPATVYRVYADGNPAAALFVVSALDGFTGAIKLLIGVKIDGTVTTVRVLQHRETPGLGDKIESSKSDWLQQFDGRSLSSPPRDLWSIRRDGGEFDQLTGASVTPRAVIKAIRETLTWFESNSTELFALPEVDEGSSL